MFESSSALQKFWIFLVKVPEFEQRQIIFLFNSLRKLVIIIKYWFYLFKPYFHLKILKTFQFSWFVPNSALKDWHKSLLWFIIYIFHRIFWAVMYICLIRLCLAYTNILQKSHKMTSWMSKKYFYIISNFKKRTV